MSQPNLIVMPGDGAANPFTIPGTSRTYTCTVGSAISVVGEDANVLRSKGWVRCGPGTRITRSGATTARPTHPEIAEGFVDSTVGAVVIFAGPVSGWRNPVTGASA
jgi:hypothetical protein